ncbi:MAG: nitroreductase family protein [Desulfarculales bacterium]|jgi:nitroreductase|nr:nitroreductase family protein [Desulfarculales bacterium]
MELIQAIKERRSVRKFKPQPVPHALLERILKDSLWAPSGMNTQPWKLFVLEGKARDEFVEVSNRAVKLLDVRLRELFNDKMRNYIHGYFKNLGGAPSVVVALSAIHPQDTYMVASYESTAALIQNLCLLAHEAGLSTCWMTGQIWVEREILDHLAVSGYRLAGVIPIGYPDQNPPAPPRKHEDITWLS